MGPFKKRNQVVYYQLFTGEMVTTLLGKGCYNKSSEFPKTPFSGRMSISQDRNW